MLNFIVTCVLKTSCKGLLCIQKSPILDQLLQIDISVLRDMLENKEKKGIKLVNSNTQLANSSMKCGASSDLMINALFTDKLY